MIIKSFEKFNEGLNDPIFTDEIPHYGEVFTIPEFKEAIEDAKVVKETAIASAKAALEEHFTPQLKSMLSAKLAEMEEMDVEEAEKDEMEEMYSKEQEENFAKREIELVTKKLELEMRLGI